MAGTDPVLLLVFLLFMGFVVVVMGGMLAALGGGVYLFSRAATGGRSTMEATDVGSVEPGAVEVSGVVRPLPDGGRVRGPFTGEEGVAVGTTVENYRSSGSSTWHWQPVHTEGRAVPFLLEDGTGQVLVDPPPDPEVDLDAEGTVVHPGEDPPERVRRYLDGTEGIDGTGSVSLGPVDAGQRRRYSEGVLTAGDEVTVRGTAVERTDAGSPRFRIAGGEAADFVVADGQIGGPLGG